jgi:rhodanese-related sulfurtransferase
VSARVDELLARCRARLPRRPAPDELAGLVERGALVVDIRPVALRERDGELPGAVVVDRNQMEWRLDPTCEHSLAEFDDTELVIVLVCDEGYASSVAAASLQDLGLVNATDLDGGYQAWRRLNPSG